MLSDALRQLASRVRSSCSLQILQLAAGNESSMSYSKLNLPLQFAPQKRNNAEVVNHILKNFGALDRLGDVGK